MEPRRDASAGPAMPARDPVRRGCGGRYWDRTSDLFRVKEARYPCANRPFRAGDPATVRDDTSRGRGSHAHPASSAAEFRGIGESHRCEFGYPSRYRLEFLAHAEMRAMRMWRSGSASPCQGEGREFESRHPLERNRIFGCGSLSFGGEPYTVDWPRGEAAACKAVYTGSNPVSTSSPRTSGSGRLAQR